MIILFTLGCVAALLPGTVLPVPPQPYDIRFPSRGSSLVLMGRELLTLSRFKVTSLSSIIFLMNDSHFPMFNLTLDIPSNDKLSVF